MDLTGREGGRKQRVGMHHSAHLSFFGGAASQRLHSEATVLHEAFSPPPPAYLDITGIIRQEPLRGLRNGAHYIHDLFSNCCFQRRRKLLLLRLFNGSVLLPPHEAIINPHVPQEVITCQIENALNGISPGGPGGILVAQTEKGGIPGNYSNSSECENYYFNFQLSI